MSQAFRSEPFEVTSRLKALGWSRRELFEVIDAMVAGRNSCTENDPASAPGWMAWKEGSRRLREIGRPKGLLKSDMDQIPWVVDTERGIRFAVSNTDDGTGYENRVPQNRSKKGPATDRAVAGNQGSLLDLLEIPEQVVPISMMRQQPGVTVSWYLCVYCAEDEVRAELSCPIELEGGFFAGFVERLVLIGPGQSLDPDELEESEPEEATEFDVQVTRK